MSLQKQAIQFNFSQGLDTKTDPKQVQLGKFLELENAVFTNGFGLTKRNGFANLTTLTNTDATSLATLNGNLLALGSQLQAYSAPTNTWLQRGTIQPVDLKALALVRSSTGQSKPDLAVSSFGQCCSVYSDNGAYYYLIQDVTTGQVLVTRTALPATATTPRVFLMNRYFIITFVATVAAAPTLQYIAIPFLNPTVPSSATNLSTHVLALGTGYDGYVVNDTLFLAWTGDDGGGAIRMTYLSSNLVVASQAIFAGKVADAVSVTADESGSDPVIWVTIYDSGTTNGWSFAVTPTLLSVLTFTKTIDTKTVTHVTSTATSGVCTIYYDNQNTYAYSAVRSDFINKVTITQAGAVGTTSTILRSVQLASKAFTDAGVDYLVVSFQSTYQPTYFVINSSGQVVAKLAYNNGGGYYSDQKLPNVTTYNDRYYFAYLFKDNLVSVNKEISATNSSNIYTQTGLNVASITINASAQYSEEIAKSLHMTGGFLWQYDGAVPVEHSFHLWPEDGAVTTATGAGSIAAGTYNYVATYEWTDASGNIHRSAPSLPLSIVTTTASSTNTIKIPTLRLTYKTSPNPVRIVLYRYSVAQPVFYQVTSISSPTANSTTTDSVTITDTLADSSILGNTLLYTTGGVAENIAAPSVAASTLYKNRLVVLDAEDRNLLWYSKQVLDTTPVEMTDLFTFYVAPTTGAQGPTGPVTALSAMDDKLIIFKESCIYYVTGTGPDNTGANNDFSEPIYITGTAGTTNPSSVVFTPVGIMFKSDKGIWLLGRDLSTKYIGADVQGFNAETVRSAICIPNTNQVRFTLSSGIVLMYDYYYNQWGTFTGIPSLSSCLYEGLHTYLAASDGLIRQETPNEYLDGSTPVLLSFKTAWAKLAGLQGFQRAYFLYLLSEYVSPHKLNVKIAYDYATSPEQTVLVTPSQVPTDWGSSSLWGSDANWGLNALEQNRIFLSKQKCQSIQIAVSEVFDHSQGVPAGAGFNMSSMLLIIGAKLGYAKLPAAQSNG